MKNVNWKKVGIFAGGVLFGTAGFSILGSKDAKKVYSQTVAAGIRAKDKVMSKVDNVKENCDDIMQDAKVINEERAKKEQEEIIEDSFTEEA